MLGRQLKYLIPQFQPSLELGRFHSLLPPDLAYRAALAQYDLPRFEQLYRSATIITPPAGLRMQLLGLME